MTCCIQLNTARPNTSDIVNSETKCVVRYSNHEMEETKENH